ncbi:MAG: molybdenum cofactor guanylyltransferase, partial [Actinomycetota bacterium]
MNGVILAGGRSRRMGTDKATYAVAGRPMLDWVAAAMGQACDRVVVAGHQQETGGLEVIADPGRPHRGPLAGLVAALHRFPGQPLAAVAVDQPWVRAGTLRRLG